MDPLKSPMYLTGSEEICIIIDTSDFDNLKIHKILNQWYSYIATWSDLKF